VEFLKRAAAGSSAQNLRVCGYAVRSGKIVRMSDELQSLEKTRGIDIASIPFGKPLHREAMRKLSLPEKVRIVV